MRTHFLRRFVVAAALLLVALPLAASARSVYLNKVKIDGVEGLKNMTFEKVNVRIDDKGDVHIDAPGYQIEVVEPGSQKTSSESAEETAQATLSKRYFLVTEQSAPGMTEFDIDVYVNAKWVRKLRNDEPQIYTEITKHLTPGKNSVLLAARKVSKGAPRSSSSTHTFRVIVGEGNVGGDHGMIYRPVVDFTATAADRTDVSKEFTFTTR